jgi:hypothetical protein
MNSRDLPNAFLPGVQLGRAGYGPHLPKIVYRDLNTVLLDAQLQVLRKDLRRDHTTHKTSQWYDTADHCPHQPLNEDEREQLLEEAVHFPNEDGYDCCTELPAGMGCADCEEFECERAAENEVMVEEFWDLFGARDVD